METIKFKIKREKNGYSALFEDDDIVMCAEGDTLPALLENIKDCVICELETLNVDFDLNVTKNYVEVVIPD